METKHLKRLPVGIQTISEIIDLDCLYIDKTEHIWNMIHLSKYTRDSSSTVWRRNGHSIQFSGLT